MQVSDLLLLRKEFLSKTLSITAQKLYSNNEKYDIATVFKYLFKNITLKLIFKLKSSRLQEIVLKINLRLSFLYKKKKQQKSVLDTSNTFFVRRLQS